MGTIYLVESRPCREAHRSSSSHVEGKNGWKWSSTPPYVFMGAHRHINPVPISSIFPKHPSDPRKMGKVKVLPVQATKAIRVGRGITLPFLRPWHWRGGWGLTPRPGRFTPRKKPVPIVQEVGWAAGPVWTGAENLATHRDSIPWPFSP